MKSDNNVRNIEKIKLLRIMSVYAVAMLLILIATILLVRPKIQKAEISASSKQDAETKYIYVRTEENGGTQSDTYTTDSEEIYTVRGYMEKIGIFSNDGTLISIIEVYTKTLPEADQRLLEEGIQIFGKKQLNAIIEDYTG